MILPRDVLSWRPHCSLFFPAFRLFITATNKVWKDMKIRFADVPWIGIILTKTCCRIIPSLAIFARIIRRKSAAIPILKDREICLYSAAKAKRVFSKQSQTILSIPKLSIIQMLKKSFCQEKRRLANALTYQAEKLKFSSAIKNKSNKKYIINFHISR